ncbi:MAG: hypothetical protein J1F39_03640 [Clostridiales bacterium]|nr:hypothetical protein [Clostridiales bacterium]
MAQNNRDRQKRNAKKNKNHDVLGVVLIAFSLFFLLCICIPPLLSVVSWGVFNIVLGVFGIAAYPALIALLMTGVFLLLQRTPSVSLKNKICIVFLIIFGLLILQLATTHPFLKSSYSQYIEQTYNAKYSAGGVIFGAIVFWLKSAITEVGCYILFSVAVIVTLVVMLDVVSKIRARRAAVAPAEKPQKQERQFVTDDEAQRVVPVTPQNRLFVGEILPKSHVTLSSESGVASDIPQRGKRTVSDYTSSPIIEYLDGEGRRSAPPSAAEEKLYGDAEEINELERKEFEEGKSAAPVRREEPTDDNQSVSEPHIRQSEDVRVSGGPKKIEHETSNDPNSQMQIFFPAPKKIHFNPSDDIISDDDIAAGLREDAKKLTRSDINRSDEERPPVGMPKFTPIDSLVSDDDDFVSMDIIAPSPDPDIIQDPPYEEPVQPEYDERDDIIVAEDMNRHYAAPQEEEIPARNDDDIITDFTQSASRYSSPVQSSPIYDGDDDIIDGSEDRDISAEPDVLVRDDDIIDGLTISDGPALDLSETHDITSDLIDGDDRSGRYVSAEDEAPVISAPKKSRSRTSPIDNQISIADEMQRQADESIVVSDAPRRKRYNYEAPPIDLLKIYPKADMSQEELQESAVRLEEVLNLFLKTTVKVINIVPGPTVTRYEVEVPSGVSVKTIEPRVSDIEYELSAVSHIRVEAPIPGKRAIGIEIPNVNRSIVGLREVIDSPAFKHAKSALTFSVGKDISGEVVLCDMQKVPHLLIAGQTGSGKSACLNGLLASLLYKSSPEDLRFILVDPKRVEFSAYQGMPHLLFDRIIYEPQEILNALKWGVMEMERRYTLMSKYGRNNAESFNSLDDVRSGKIDKISQIVIVIDELADVMQSTLKGEIEEKIKTIAAKARAAGIHLIVATQRPSRDVLTGTIKANLSSRIAFRVSSQVDSRIIIDTAGAEALVGNGDMLFYPVDYTYPKRVQGSYISDVEVGSVISYIKEHYETDFDEAAKEFVFNTANTNGGGGAGGAGGESGKDEDELFPSVLEAAIKSGTVSVSGIQRRFSIGYARAARMMDTMVDNNYVGPSTNNGKARDVTITRDQFRELYGRDIDE